MLEIDWATSFKKDFKKFKHNHDLLEELNVVLKMLVNITPLPACYKDHNLIGNWADHRECHIRNDVLLIYRTDAVNLILVRLNSHSELFKKK